MNKSCCTHDVVCLYLHQSCFLWITCIKKETKRTFYILCVLQYVYEQVYLYLYCGLLQWESRSGFIGLRCKLSCWIYMCTSCWMYAWSDAFFWCLAYWIYTWILFNLYVNRSIIFLLVLWVWVILAIINDWVFEDMAK